jgi:hypothetical protein
MAGTSPAITRAFFQALGLSGAMVLFEARFGKGKVQIREPLRRSAVVATGSYGADR